MYDLGIHYPSKIIILEECIVHLRNRVYCIKIVFGDVVVVDQVFEMIGHALHLSFNFGFWCLDTMLECQERILEYVTTTRVRPISLPHA